jgi:hypothetical protein
MRLARISPNPDQDVADRHLDDIDGRLGPRPIIDRQWHERRRADDPFRRREAPAPKAPSPIVDLPAGRPMSARYIRHDGAGRQTLGGDPRLLRLRTSSTSRRAGNDIDAPRSRRSRRPTGRPF